MINQKRQEIAKAAAAAANELEELEATAMALGAIVPSSPNQPANPPTFNTAAVLQRPNNEQEAARPHAHPTHSTTISIQYQDNPLSPTAQEPVQHQTNNAADNNATQAYDQHTDTQPSSAPTNNSPQDPARAGSSSPTAQKPELYQPHHTPRPDRHQNKSITADTPNGDQ